MNKDKYLQIFNYLLDFSKIRSKVVSNINNEATYYPEVIWFQDIPKSDSLYNLLDDNIKNDYWLKITKPVAPIHPKFGGISQNLKKWLKNESWLNEKERPILNETIIDNNIELSLTEHPHIKEEFSQYIQSSWKNDLNHYQTTLLEYNEKLEIYKSLERIYTRFFKVYNKVQQFGEEFELVIGVGLFGLNSRSEKSPIFRHLLTQKIEISFNQTPKGSNIQIKPVEASSYQFELDFLTGKSDSLDIDCILDAEKNVKIFLEKNECNNLLGDNAIKDALARFADRCHVKGKFDDSILKQINLDENPTVNFAPAILFRKRNTRSFSSFYEQIINNIDEDGQTCNLPLINNLIDIPNEKPETTLDPDRTSNPSLSETIYFPKESNEEQFKIIEKTNSGDIVVVQGPPGTGKSHTIANLICHLLATGKKTLITAYNRRALDVLKDKLPEQFRSLAVNLLSNDSDSHKELQKSVNSISSELASAIPKEYQSKINQLTQELDLLRKNISKKTNESILLKEKSSRSISINPNYEGTLLEIAEKINQESTKYNWYKDNYENVENHEVFLDLQKFIEQAELYKNIDLSCFDFNYPPLKNLPSTDDFSEYLRNCKILSDKFRGLESYPDEFITNHHSISDKIKSLSHNYEIVNKISFPLKNEIISDLKKGCSQQWKQKLSESNDLIKQLNSFNLKEIDDNIEIIYNCPASPKQLKNDAQILLSYTSKGKSLSGTGFKLRKAFLPHEIKERLYFIDAVRYNGSACDTMEELQAVLDDLKIKQLFKELNEIWNLTGQIPDSFKRQVEYFNDLNKNILRLIKLFDSSENHRNELNYISTMEIEAFDFEKVNQIKLWVEFAKIDNDKSLFEEKVNDFTNTIKKQKTPQVIDELISNLNDSNELEYQTNIQKYKILIDDYVKYQDYLTQAEILKENIPLLIEEIQSNTISLDFVSKFQDAVLYKHAKTKIEKILNEGNEQQLFQDLLKLDEEEKDTISKLASTQAWNHLTNRLKSNPSLIQHLKAWTMASKKIPKTGIGKNAVKFRRIAQQEMEKCKDSIPCWIMPLYKVAETIKPQPKVFDYIIIDEASQLGPDATFLLYLAKKIIVVGDDKQTSPEFVGVKSETISPLIKKHLGGNQFSEFLGIDYSFFELSDLFCEGNKVVLREHFRCMPEIIEFSNRLFYEPENNKLYPLKQYSENRLEPLVTVYCEDGYVENKNANIVNKPEAEKIANHIKSLINDPRYLNKTIGVITLQGTQQALHIENLLLEKIGDQEYFNRKIICGNSASFQGDERDIILLSLVTAVKHSRSSLVKANDERRFNVAMSRAIEQVILFHSVQLEDLSNKNDLRYKLLNYFKNYKVTQPIQTGPIERTLGSQPKPFDSWFEVNVYNDIVRKGFKVIPQYEVAGGRYRIDLVVIKNDGSKLAVECDGDKWHGPEHYQNDMMRQKVLERCGWQFFRIKGSEYYLNKEKSLTQLWNLLGEKMPKQNSFQPKETIVIDDSENRIDPKKHIHQTYQGYGEEKSISIILKNCPPIKKTEPVFQNINTCDALVFTSKANVYKVLVENNASKKDIISKLRLEGDEKVRYITKTFDYTGWMLFGFENGKLAKVDMSSYNTQSNRKRLKNAFSLLSKVKYISHSKEDIDLVTIATNNKVLIFNTSGVSSVMSSNSLGVQVLKLKDNCLVKNYCTKDQVKFMDYEFYRKNIPAVGFFLKKEDKISKVTK